MTDSTSTLSPSRPAAERPAPPVVVAGDLEPGRTRGGGDGGKRRNGGEGGGGGGGGGDAWESGPPIENAQIAVVIFLCSIFMLFLGLLSAYTVFRFSAPAWPPPDAPRLPRGLWVPTLVIVLSSLTLARAQIAARAGDARALRLSLLLTSIFGIAFVGVQAWLWRQLFQAGLTHRLSLYGSCFYALTGLHAAHVLAGVVVLAVVLARAWRGRYTSAAHGGVTLTALYWHFVGAVWMLLFGVLYLAE